MMIRARSSLLASLALALCAFSAIAVAQTTLDPADAFTERDLGNGRVEVVRPGHPAVTMNMVKKQDKDSISVQVQNPNSADGGYFRYLERERRIEAGSSGRQFIVQINDNGTVNVGNAVCDGRKDQECIASALTPMLEGLPVEGVIAMRAALNDALLAQGMPLGKEIRETFRDLVRDLMRRENVPRVR